MQHIQTKDLDLLRISLHRITFLKFEEKKILLKNLDSSYSLALLSIEEISNFIHRRIDKRVIWNGAENLHMAKTALQYCNILGIKILFYEDLQFPELLRQISDPPLLLFCRGDVSILGEKSVSVVGTRKLTQQGKVAAKSFAYEVVNNGCNVISGLANGADGYAHQGALDAFFDALDNNSNTKKIGKTVAVLPCAIDEIVPSVHKRMAMQIIQSGGCIVSEYEPKMGMANWHFVGRNRIIAGLSPGTVVIEAPAGSGALITADFALEYNREVMFHQVCFGESAVKVSDITFRQLETEYVLGRVSKYKIENRPEKYLEAGAQVISNYKDYCTALRSSPGVQNNQPVQGNLF